MSALSASSQLSKIRVAAPHGVFDDEDNTPDEVPEEVTDEITDDVIEEVTDDEPEDGEPEDGEPEDGEPNDDEPEDGEPEDDEPEEAAPVAPIEAPMRPEAGTTIEVVDAEPDVPSVTYTYNPEKMLDDTYSTHYAIFERLCAVGTALKYTHDRTLLDTHPVIYSILLLCRAFEIPEHVVDKLTTGLITKCISYATHHNPEYIPLVKVMFGGKRVFLNRFLVSCAGNCEGLKEGEFDADGFPVPVNKFGIASFIINTIKLFRKKITAGIIASIHLVKFLDSINRILMDTIYVASTSENTRNNAKKVSRERNMMRRWLLIKVGDPMFDWLKLPMPRHNEVINEKEDASELEFYEFPEMEVEGLGTIKEGERFINDPEDAYQLMIEATGGVDPSAPGSPKGLTICGGLPSLVVDGRVTRDTILYQNTDVDNYTDCDMKPPSRKNNETSIAAIHERISHMDPKCVLAVMVKACVMNVYPPNARPWQFITVPDVDGPRIINEFDFSQVKVWWAGGRDFYMTPDAYLTFAYGYTHINTINGYDPLRIVKTVLRGFKVARSNLLDSSPRLKAFREDPAMFERLAREYLYDQITYTTARGRPPTKADYERMRSRLERSNREYAFIGEQTDMNRAIGCLEMRTGSFRRTYGPSEHINVVAMNAARLAKFPANNVDDWYLRKTGSGRVFTATFTACTLNTITSMKDGSVKVTVFANPRANGEREGRHNDSAALHDLVQLIEGAMCEEAGAPNIENSVMDGEKCVTFVFTKAQIEKSKNDGMCIFANQHGLPRDTDDYVDTNVKFRMCSGEFNVLYTRSGQNSKFVFRLRELRVYEEYQPNAPEKNKTKNTSPTADVKVEGTVAAAADTTAADTTAADTTAASTSSMTTTITTATATATTADYADDEC